MKRFLTSTAILCALGAHGQWLTDSLIAHFPMDSSPNDVIGLLVPTVTSGTPTFCADRFGNPEGAACFDGASFWSYGDTLDMDTSDFSMAYWAYLDTVRPPFYVSGTYLSDGSMLVCKGATVYGTPQRAGYALAARNYNGVYALTAMWGGALNDLVYDETPITLHEWFHVVQSRCGAHQTLHLNGQLVIDTVTTVSRDLGVDIFFALGALDRDPTSHPDQGWLHGALDDIRMFKGRCLSQAEIETLAGITNVGLEHMTPRNKQWTLFPNPASSAVHINLPFQIAGNGSVQVCDGMGRVVLSSAIGRRLQVDFNISHLSEGLYHVFFTGQERLDPLRFIKD